MSLSMARRRTLLRWVGSVHTLIYWGVLCRHLAYRSSIVLGGLGKACRSLNISVLWAEGDFKGVVVILWVYMYRGTNALYIFNFRVFRYSALMLSCHCCHACHGVKVDSLSYTRIFANCNQSSAHSGLSCIAPFGETPPRTSQFDLAVLIDRVHNLRPTTARSQAPPRFKSSFPISTNSIYVLSAQTSTQTRPTAQEVRPSCQPVTRPALTAATWYAHVEPCIVSPFLLDVCICLGDLGVPCHGVLGLRLSVCCERKSVAIRCVERCEECALLWGI